MECIFSVNEKRPGYVNCEFSFMFLIGYVLSIFILQLSLTSVSLKTLFVYKLFS